MTRFREFLKSFPLFGKKRKSHQKKTRPVFKENREPVKYIVRKVLVVERIASQGSKNDMSAVQAAFRLQTPIINNMAFNKNSTKANAEPEYTPPKGYELVETRPYLCMFGKRKGQRLGTTYVCKKEGTEHIQNFYRPLPRSSCQRPNHKNHRETKPNKPGV